MGDCHFFRVIHRDNTAGARCGVLDTPHGQVLTPAFLPSASHGTVKACSPADLEQAGVQMLCSNAYYLHLRPGEELVRKLGGLHNLMAWNHPILTDSGGYQVFSLENQRKMSEEGVWFRSSVDGSERFFSPEVSIAVQEALGADVIMAFDECTPYPCSRQYAEESVELTARWAERSKAAHNNTRQLLFGIVQGSVYPDLRIKSAQQILSVGFDGYALGGLSVGEPKEETAAALEATIPLLPEDKPRYLMGVGAPEDILSWVGYGIDLFDCVAPTKNARHGTLYTALGSLHIKNAKYATDERQPDPDCDCYTCRNFSLAYLRYLFLAKESLWARLSTLHNLHFYSLLMTQIRQAISAGRLKEFVSEMLPRLTAQAKGNQE
jgi:queuine tRNA-ribosyltransferase